MACDYMVGAFPFILKCTPACMQQFAVALDSPLTCREACDIVAGMCAGLAYMHARDIVHQRLGADKILLTSDMRAKITGVGEAVAVKATFADVPSDLKGVVVDSAWAIADLVRCVALFCVVLCCACGLHAAPQPPPTPCCFMHISPMPSAYC